ncbi:MAG: DUF2726 domain-containing protein [Comamonadaceae bacterium]|nr:DUF2726 domain-containing protein [Comamonadaceae bacterium]RRD56629.1 DUF2726 domain-containing protein [Comamonadaceae bacterium OH2545_COT-014]
MSIAWLVLLLAALAAAAFFFYRQRQQRHPASSRNDRYSAKEPITPAQYSLMLYLQEAFPGQPVLFNVPLSHVVTIRHADDRRRAQARLAGHWVDFVVCQDDGAPQFAFQVDAYHVNNAEEARRTAALRHRILGSAGVRLLRLKKSVRDMPPPHVLRSRLLDVGAPAPMPTMNSEPAPVTLPGALQSPAEAPSDSMSLTDLMGLPREPRQ